MIVSASRRSDIPALYPRWLANRLASGYCETKNPFNPTQKRKLDLRPAPVGELDALILWTRNPEPLLERVFEWEASGIKTLWLVTVTGYPKPLEPHAPDADVAIAAVEKLARLVGSRRISWRYDPIFPSPDLEMDAAFHEQNFTRLAGRLSGKVGRCIVSLYDDYAKSRKRLREAKIGTCTGSEGLAAAERIAAVASSLDLPLQSCSEELESASIPPAGCIDGALLDELWQLDMNNKRDKNQRRECLCAPSVDIGAYDTCTHGCLYCYATGARATAQANRSAHDEGAVCFKS